MKKYNYKYCVYLNNCGAGIQFLKAFENLAAALNYKEYIQTVAGCCDVVKKRFTAGSETPVKNHIENNYKYHSYNLL